MAFIQASFYSPVLIKHVAMNLLVPEGRRGPFPVFYLLHGLSDDSSVWQRFTRIEAYVRELPLIVAMPDGFRGFYTDNDAGPAYGRYILEDVIGFVERTFPAQGKRSGRFIGGLSMGGYGSLRLGLSRPDLFASVTSHSAPAQPYLPEVKPECAAELRRVFGPRPAGSNHDIAALARKLKRSGRPLPRLRIDCGTEDSLLGHNRELHAELQRLGVAHEYAEFPGGHDWDYWDTHVQSALKFHLRQKTGERRSRQT